MEWYKIISTKIINDGLSNIDLLYVKNNKEIKDPLGYASFEEFEDYVLTVHKIQSTYNFTKYFIDGRARPFCAEQILRYIKPNEIIFVHDWGRDKYYDILKWYKLIEVEDTLAILKTL